MRGWSALRTGQARFVEDHLPGARVIEDMSWRQGDILVLRMRAGDHDFVTKAAGPGNRHIGREITGHELATAPLVARGASARLVASDRSLNVLVTTFLAGQLVERTDAEVAVHVHAQAGRLLRALHEQTARTDEQYERDATDRALTWLDRTHRIDPAVDREARGILRGHRPHEVAVVPTHGDWQPRNWLIDDDEVRVIDWGRFAFRPASTDLCRLAAQQWRSNPALEAAFLSGYGGDPRDERTWPIEQLREAIATAVWAYQVGDEPFERQGHRMLAEALACF